MREFLQIVELTSPLFLLVLVAYALARLSGVVRRLGDWLTRLVFGVALPVLLFRLMSGLPALPPTDPSLLIAFFTSCLAVFALGRVIAARMLGLERVAQSIFAVAGVFSNIVMLGVPLGTRVLGEAALPAISLVVVFNALILWSVVSVSIEWSKSGAATLRGLGRTALQVLANPVIVGILAGTAFGYAGFVVPPLVASGLDLIAAAAGPLSLFALGAGLAGYGVREGWRVNVAICVLKLVAQPLGVLLAAHAIGLPRLETQAIVLLAAMPVGANVYLMSRHFGTLGGPVAASMVLSTALAAVTVPAMLTLEALLR
jgi:malonate transporter